jgi:hypothetical protein
VHPSRLPSEELFSQCRMTRGKSSGPGGQHRNKVATKVMLEHVPTGVLSQAGEMRRGEENRSIALRRLRLELAMKVRMSVPRGEIRSALWKRRCDVRGRIVCNPNHEDYPALLAEALDVIAACGWDEKKASLRLVCTVSQLIKLVKDHPAALEYWNQQRAERGEHVLK